jgi:hypothetical protein
MGMSRDEQRFAMAFRIEYPVVDGVPEFDQTAPRVDFWESLAQLTWGGAADRTAQLQEPRMDPGVLVSSAESTASCDALDAHRHGRRRRR